MKGERGFTLIELMIVVAIIAILAGILIPNFTHARAQAQTAACESNLRQIATAFELFYADNQRYPGPGGSITNASINAAGLATINSGATYLNNIPTDPAATSSTAAYTYSTVAQSGSTPASYTIVCPGRHDPATLQKLQGSGASTSTINYASGTGLGAQ